MCTYHGVPPGGVDEDQGITPVQQLNVLGQGRLVLGGLGRALGQGREVFFDVVGLHEGLKAWEVGGWNEWMESVRGWMDGWMHGWMDG